MKKSEQEAILKRFYNAWLLWARGGVSDYPFDPRRGLCTNLLRFLNRQPEPIDREDRWEISALMDAQFCESHLDPAHPFNINGDEYHYEEDKRTNAARVAWCASHLD